MTRREKQMLAGELMMLNAVMNAAHEELERKIEKIRRADRRCIECGSDLVGNEEGGICDSCYLRFQRECADERKHPDQRG